MLEIKQLDEQQIKTIYDTHIQRDFPQEEIHPYSILKRNIDNKTYRAYGLFTKHTHELAAYALFIAPSGGSLLLDYYAVVPQYRGAGEGGRFLLQLKALLHDRSGIVLEVEDPDYALDGEGLETAKRRIEFYKRCGAVETGIKSKVRSARYRIMFLPCAAEADRTDYRAELAHVYSVMFTKQELLSLVELSGTEKQCG